MSGGELFGFNNAVFLSEREAADRNYALGFYMRENKCFPDKCNLRECMDFYFQVNNFDVFIFSLCEESKAMFGIYKMKIINIFTLISNKHTFFSHFKCCSMEATCDTMSIVAATLANGGICPFSEEKIFRPDVVRDVLSLMHSCGMYDYSGQFAFKVGVPAKSGVCGGMLVVIPNVMGIFTWSPPLDPLG